MEQLLCFHSGCCPHDSCLLGVVRGFRNGVIYGCKIRFPHALVMTFLFKDGTFQEKVTAILKMTYQHSKNLGIYVAVYKAICCALRYIRQKETGLNSLVGGFCSGVLMWGDDNPVNSQINMYILSRISWGLVRAGVKNGWLSVYKYAYPLYAGIIWALVMYLFHYQDGTLQSSLISSMTYLYNESNEWPKTGNIADWFLQ